MDVNEELTPPPSQVFVKIQKKNILGGGGVRGGGVGLWGSGWM